MRTEKKFDSVMMMREIRDRLSKKLINMSYEEQKEYIKKRLKKSQIKHDNKKNIHVAQ